MFHKTLIFLLSMFLISMASAVTLDIGLNLSADNGAEIYIDTIPIIVTQAVVEDNAVALTNPSWTNGNLIVNATGLVNHTSGSVKSSQFPRLTTDTDEKKVFASSLTGVTGSYTFPVDNCENIGNIKHGSSLYQRGSYTCANNQVTITLTSVSNGDELTIEYGCSTFTRLGFNLIMILTSLAVVVFVLVFLFREGWENVTIAKVIIAFVAIVFSLVLWLAAGQNLGGACPVS